MIIQDIFIRKAGNWHVRIYHAVDAMYADEIIDELITIGCSGETLKEAKQSLWKGAENSGLTYSNLKTHETVMVIGLTTDGSEYWNSLDHEKNHLLAHISQACGIDPYGERISYISGEFIRDVYDKAKGLLCDSCRKSVYRRLHFLKL